MKWLNPRTWFGGGQPRAEYRDAISEEKAIELIAGGYGVPTVSGFVVNETTAMRVSVVYRCVSLIAGTIASLPCEIYRWKDGKSEIAEDHPAFRLLHDEPSALMTANTFWKNFLWAACMRGNGYGLIGRTSLGAPVSVSWVHPTAVTPKLSPNKTRLFYDVRLATGETRTFDQDDVLHYPFIGWDGEEGRAPLECARDAIGLAASAQEYNERFFSQGNASEIKMEFPGALKDDQLKRIIEVYEKTRTGQRGMRLPLIATGGGKIERMDFNAEDSQLIEARNFQVEDICRFYGVPPHMVGHTSKTTSWGSGIEEQTLGFVKFTLRDILKGVEQEVNRKVLRSGRFYCKFNLDALLRADSKGRAEFYKAAIGGTQNPGFMTVNEVRALENLSPLPGGDTLFVPKSKTTDESKKEADNAAD
jgi:HK97 family phage portal protein